MLFFNSDERISVTDLCRWPGWGGAAAAPWRSPRAAPQSAGLGGGRTGRCGPEPSVGVTSARPPFPDPSQLPVPPVWETAAPRCRRRWEELTGTSLACRCPDLEKQRRWRGSKVSDCISGGPPEVKVCYMIRKGRLQRQRATWHCDGELLSWENKVSDFSAENIYISGKNIKILSRTEDGAQIGTVHFEPLILHPNCPRGHEFISKSTFLDLKPFSSLFSSRKIGLTIILGIIIHGAPLVPSGLELRKPKPL